MSKPPYLPPPETMTALLTGYGHGLNANTCSSKRATHGVADEMRAIEPQDL
jgi:hypothetical protein